jgi:hypothetical protein
MALEDHSPEHSWWLAPATGEVDPRFESSLEDSEPDPSLIYIEPLPTAVGYADMEAFVAAVRDPRARDLLERAIAGRESGRAVPHPGRRPDGPERCRPSAGSCDRNAPPIASRWVSIAGPSRGSSEETLA